MTWWKRVADRRPPDLVIAGKSGPYMNRWWLVTRNPVLNVYLHQFLRSDEDEALHDHMYVNLSVLLEGEYVEHTISQGGVHHRTRRRAGEWKFRLPRHAHRIEVDGPCWSLFVTGPRVRSWGFHCPSGWVHWKSFISKKDQTGEGCRR